MSQPVGILHVVQSFSLGGAERMAVELANRAFRDEFRPAILATRGGGPLRTEVRDEVPVLILGRERRWDPRHFAAFQRFVRENQIRLIHSHGPGPLQYSTAALLAGRMRRPHVFHDHHGRESALLPNPALAVRIAFRLGLSAVIGVSRLACEWASRRLGWPGEKTFLLRNGIAPERFLQAQPAAIRGQLGLREDELLLGMVANFRWEKDHLTALQALAQCRSRDRLRLFLVGGSGADPGGYEGRTRRAAELLGINDRVVFAGPRRDVPEVLAACDAGLLSSCRESGPLALLEYLAAGLPFASTRVGEIGGELPDGEVGFFAPPAEPAALASALDQLAALDASARRRMGERGRSLVLREYDQRHTADRLTGIYRQVLQW